MNVNQKIKHLANSRGWSEYRLAKESGLASSTIANIYHRDTIPSIPTLEILCKAFGITLAQFFSEGAPVHLTKEQAQLLDCYSALNPAQRDIMLKLLKTMK